MTSKERVLCAFDRVPADRVPVDYTANAGIDLRLKAHFGLAENDGEGLLKALGVDFRNVGPRYTGPVLHENNIPDRQIDPQSGIHRRWIEHSSGGYWDYCDFPLEFADEETVAAWKLPSPDDFDYETVLDQIAKHREYAVCFPCFGDYINGNGMLRGMEQTLIDLVTDDPAGLLLGKRRFELQTGMIERVLDRAKGGIDILWIGEDLGTQIGQMISIDTFRKHLKPLYQPMIDLAKHYGARVMIHTCGSSSWAYEDFIAMGVDAADTLQPEAVNMSPRYLADTFGGRLSFHGCISTAGPLAFGKVADVTEDVRATLEIMLPTNSYMLCPTHAIQDNSPTENVLEMYHAARTLGIYR